MKIAIINNDFRAYWKDRLNYLHDYFESKNISISAVELFGKGSPYTFDTLQVDDSWQHCLFPNKSAAELSSTEIKKALFKHLDELDADVVIAPSIVFYAGALGIAWAKKRLKKFIMFDDARPAQLKRSFTVQWVKNVITMQADALWLPSKSYDLDYGMFQNKGLLFFYGLACTNNSLFQANEHNVKAKTIICVARLVPIKNLSKLLTAWQQVEQRGTGYRLLILGDGPERGNLEELRLELGLKALIFTDAVTNEDLPPYLTKAEAFILPSLSETWGLVVNEAMAAGLPVLLSRTVNAGRDLLQEGDNGYSFDPNSVNSIVEAIVQYTQLSEHQKVAMSKKSMEIIDAMSYDTMADQMNHALNQLIKSPFKPTGFIARALIACWRGRYNTSRWDKL